MGLVLTKYFEKQLDCLGTKHMLLDGIEIYTYLSLYALKLSLHTKDYVLYTLVLYEEQMTNCLF